jgi:hypothetical protein
MIELYCEHSFHKECLEEWVRQETTPLSCPMCKRKLSLEGLRRYEAEGERVVNIKRGDS